MSVELWHKSRMNSDMTVVTLQNDWHVSDLIPHMEVAQFGIETIRLRVVCAVMKNRSVSREQINNLATFACGVNVAQYS